MKPSAMIHRAEELTEAIKASACSHRYIDEFLGLKCASDLLEAEVFPNAKEITESFACLNAARKHLRPAFDLGDKRVVCVVVGDGSTPRTGATFAYRTAWNVVSVDPNMKWDNKNVARLWVHKGKIEDKKIDCSGNPAVLIQCHSHAPLPAALGALYNASRIAVVAIPCCVPQELTTGFWLNHGSPHAKYVTGRLPTYEYQDYGITSPQRTVKVWTGVTL